MKRRLPGTVVTDVKIGGLHLSDDRQWEFRCEVPVAPSPAEEAKPCGYVSNPCAERGGAETARALHVHQAHPELNDQIKPHNLNREPRRGRR